MIGPALHVTVWLISITWVLLQCFLLFNFDNGGIFVSWVKAIECQFHLKVDYFFLIVLMFFSKFLLNLQKSHHYKKQLPVRRHNSLRTPIYLAGRVVPFSSSTNQFHGVWTFKASSSFFASNVEESICMPGSERAIFEIRSGCRSQDRFI